MALCNSKNKVKGIPQGSANSAVLANVYMLKYYLGFSFDGTKVKIRDKTMTKYYYRMHRKVNTVGRWLYKHKRMETNSLYRLYSDSRSKKEKKQENIDRKCKFRKYEGNFITYIKRARKIMGKEIFIDKCESRHMTKIRRRLTKVTKSK